MSDITQKIAKIIAKADGTTHPEEAAAFMAKAHKLMEERVASRVSINRQTPAAPGVKRLS